MNTTESSRPRHHGWVIGLAILSLVVPMATGFPFCELNLWDHLPIQPV